MKSKLCMLLLKYCGWKYIGNLPDVKKAIIIAVPHTSNWDFIWGKLTFLAYNIPTSILMKKEMFFFPLKYLLNAWGIIPVDRSKKVNLTDQLAEEFNKRDSLYLALAPEGSRSLRTQWKMGFYYIALKAQVPIFLAELNYQDKTLTCGEMFQPTGDAEKDMLFIRKRYENAKAKYPENFSTGL